MLLYMPFSCRVPACPCQTLDPHSWPVADRSCPHSLPVRCYYSASCEVGCEMEHCHGCSEKAWVDDRRSLFSYKMCQYRTYKQQKNKVDTHLTFMETHIYSTPPQCCGDLNMLVTMFNSFIQ